MHLWSWRHAWYFPSHPIIIWNQQSSQYHSNEGKDPMHVSHKHWLHNLDKYLSQLKWSCRSKFTWLPAFQWGYCWHPIWKVRFRCVICFGSHRSCVYYEFELAFMGTFSCWPHRRLKCYFLSWCLVVLKTCLIIHFIIWEEFHSAFPFPRC